MKKAAIALAVTAISLASCVGGAPSESSDSAPEETGETQQALATPCPFVDPADPQFVPLAYPVNFAAELMITAVPVVDDPCRTTWTGACPPGAIQAAWTFGRLMSQMAGAIPPQQFVADWIHQWEIPLAINGFAVPPRPNVRAALIDPWLVASGCMPGAPIVGPGACPLKLQRAPFRLLAIANRPDLACAGYTGVGDAEARFIFGVIDPAGNPLDALIILEYKLPTQRAGVSYTAFNWEQDWHKLSDPAMGPIGSAPYLAYLQALLTDITSPGVMPGGPNFGNAIGQVRTNELSFGGIWALREARLQNTGAGPNAMPLMFTTTAETPDDTQNASVPLDAYLLSQSMASGSPNLMNFTQAPIPLALSGGESTAPFLWNHSVPATLSPIERHHFGFNTCNGCHTVEVQTPFVHVSNRPFGVPATLSPFLSPAAGPCTPGPGFQPPACLNVPDPAGTGAVFEYNEPWRRVCEATRMLGGSPACHSRANGSH